MGWCAVGLYVLFLFCRVWLWFRVRLATAHRSVSVFGVCGGRGVVVVVGKRGPGEGAGRERKGGEVDGKDDGRGGMRSKHSSTVGAARRCANVREMG